MNTKLNIAFFGGEPLGLPTLKALVHNGIIPSLVVCNPDRPSGRGLHLQAPAIKTWAIEHDLAVFQPDSYKDPSTLAQITDTKWDLFVVVAYNVILPKWFLELPKHGVLNVHPSLLPKLRGMSPIRTAILENLPEQVGVSIMLMDEKMDHGPLLAQTPLSLSLWPIPGTELDQKLAQSGGELLAATIPQWLSQNITPTEQKHLDATYTKKFEKINSELNIDPTNLPSGEVAHRLLLKIYAYEGIGDTFFIDNGVRVKIKSAGLSAGTLALLRVIPDGKKEMDFGAYLHTRSK